MSTKYYICRKDGYIAVDNTDRCLKCGHTEYLYIGSLMGDIVSALRRLDINVITIDIPMHSIPETRFALHGNVDCIANQIPGHSEYGFSEFIKTVGKNSSTTRAFITVRHKIIGMRDIDEYMHKKMLATLKEKLESIYMERVFVG